MILLVDNDDSFTYNILELLRRTTHEQVTVINHRDVNVDLAAHYNAFIFSPGPSLPHDFPIMDQLLTQYDSSKAILGICLGHQAICEHYGAQLVKSDRVHHGEPSMIECNPDSMLFAGLTNTVVGRYHSWLATNIPSELRITASDSHGSVMAVEHLSKRVFGVQFHPESYITEAGELILKNFIHATSK